MPEVIARAVSERGELVLQSRGEARELRVNGVFVMDTEHTETERLLASETLGQVEGDGLRVLIGGLGLGYTLREVLRDDRVRQAHVIEIEPELLDWHQRGLVPETAAALRDPRTRVSIGDIAEVLGEQEPCDVLLLDVDNGPDFLVYEHNSALYGTDFLTRCAAVLNPGGTIAVWSADTSPGLLAAMREVFGGCTELVLPVVLGQRETTYHLFVSRALTGDDAAAPDPGGFA